MGPNEVDVNDVEGAFERIRAQAAADDIRITQHAQQEMVEEDIIRLMKSWKLLLQAEFWRITLGTAAELVVCSMVLHVAAALYISCVRQHDLCLSSLRSMNPDHQSG